MVDMKICEVSQYYAPYTGGQEAYVRGLSRTIAKRGHRVSVVTTSKPDNESHDLGVEIAWHSAALRPMNNPISFAAIRETELLESSDVIHVHNEHSFLSLSVAALRERFSAPLVLTVHGQLKFGSLLYDTIRSVYSKSAGNLILRKADCVFVNSHEDGLDVLRRGVPRERVIEVSNAIDTNYLSQFEHSRARTETIQRLGLEDNAKVILFVGRLIPRKGIRTLLEAFERYFLLDRDVVLVVVGDGPLAPILRSASASATSRKAIIWKPWIEPSLLYSLYQAATVFVLPSLAEVCPTALLEALFFGCQCIATDIPGVRDHFRGMVTLVPPNDSQTLAGELRRLVEDREDTGFTREDVRKTLAQRYNWESVADAYLSTFAKLVAVG